VGVAENPRSGVGARGSSVKKGFLWGKRTLFFGIHVLPLLNLLIVVILPLWYWLKIAEYAVDVEKVREQYQEWKPVYSQAGPIPRLSGRFQYGIRWLFHGYWSWPWKRYRPDTAWITAPLPRTRFWYDSLL
jgi:hypothetical protein